LSETKEKWISTSRARIGWAWDRALVYITGGLASAKVDATVTFAPGSFTDTHTLYGWTAGAGVEYAFLNNWSLKVEYLYARFENQAYLFTGAPITPRGALNLDNHIVRAGLNWKFTDCVYGNCGGPVVAKY
jgi:outer membrane immunogenic protein